MNDSEMTAVDASSVGIETELSYPHPFDDACKGRLRRTLGDIFGLSDFGVNLVTLGPGTWSSQRHWHTEEDEFIYVLEGSLTLITDAGRTVLTPGMCAGFKSGVQDGHHLVNESDAPALYLELGTRNRKDACNYPDIDLHLAPQVEGGNFSHKDGTAY